MNSLALKKTCTAALLIAIGIVIPMFMPKVQIEPASFTLASHVPIFLGMFISPWVGVAVAIGTSIGFFVSTTVVVGLRAASHIIFAVVGGLYIKHHPRMFENAVHTQVFNVLIGILHAAAELAVVSLFYMSTSGLSPAYYEKGFAITVFGLVGVGTWIHSMVDFEIALIIRKALKGRFPLLAGTQNKAVLQTK
jgi:niacin transporter